MVVLCPAFGQQLRQALSGEHEPDVSRPAFLFPERGESVPWKRLPGDRPSWPAFSSGVSARGNTDMTQRGRGAGLTARARRQVRRYGEGRGRSAPVLLEKELRTTFQPTDIPRSTWTANSKELRAMIPVQASTKELSLNAFQRLAPGAERGTRKTAHVLVRSAAAMSTVRLNMTPTEIHHCFVAFPSAFPVPLLYAGQMPSCSLSSTVDNY